MKTSLVLFIIVMLLTGCSVNDQADDIDNVDFNVSDTLKFNSNGPKGAFSEIFPIDGMKIIITIKYISMIRKWIHQMETFYID